MMGSMSIWHWLGNIGSDVGKAVKGFKDGVKGGEDENKTGAPGASSANTQQVADKSTIDVEAKEKNKL
jgi:sec-independent protein translocase protein TatA